MALFIIGNILSALALATTSTCKPRYRRKQCRNLSSIGAVVATNLVSEKMAGRAVGQDVQHGLTLANVLRVPPGTWVSLQFGWHTTFFTVAALGTIAADFNLNVNKIFRSQRSEDIKTQLLAFKNPALLINALMLLWRSGFMTLYGYLAPLAMHITGFGQESMLGS